MARETSTNNPLKRLFRSEPPPDTFRALADKLEDSVLLIGPEGSQILDVNHAFLLLSGYTRLEIETLSASQLFLGEPGARALADALALPQGQSLEARDVPIQTRNDVTLLVDLDASRVAGEASPILMTASPSLRRKQIEDQAAAQSARVEVLVDISERLMEGAVGALNASLDHAQTMLHASAVGLYRVSPTSPDYILEGSLSEAFPRACLPDRSSLSTAAANGLSASGRGTICTRRRERRGLGACGPRLSGHLTRGLACWSRAGTRTRMCPRMSMA